MIAATQPITATGPELARLAARTAPAGGVACIAVRSTAMQAGGVRHPPFHQVPVRRRPHHLTEHVNHPGAAETEHAAGGDRIERRIGVLVIEQDPQLPGQRAVAGTGGRRGVR